MLKVVHPPTWGPERAYVLHVILGEWLGLKYCEATEDATSWQITQVGDATGRTLEIVDPFFSMPPEQWLKVESLPLSIRSWSPRATLSDVPDTLGVLYGQELEGDDYLMVTPDLVRLGVDIFGTAFFMLTRYEEVANRKRDDIERFSSHQSVLSATALLQRPIVNEHLELLWWALRSLWPDLTRRPRVYRCLLSCDVDNVSIMGISPLRALRSIAGRSIRGALQEGPLSSVFGRATRRWSAWSGGPGKDELDDFDFLMDQADHYGCRFVFNFIAGHGVMKKDGLYGVERLGIRRLMRRIVDRGHELGFHGSYESFRNRDVLIDEFRHLTRVAAAEGLTQVEWGGRQHYLRWEAPTTWQAYDDAGLAYDSTLAYADVAGFRCGTCYNYPAFNLLTRKVLRVRERPLVVMDGSLTNAAYMGLSVAEAVAMVAALSAQCRRYNGEFTLLWHNGQTNDPSMCNAFKAMLQVAASAEVASPVGGRGGDSLQSGNSDLNGPSTA